MRIKTIILVLIMLSAFPAISPSEMFTNPAGTEGTQFLKITPGARPAAMGGAYTANIDDANVINFNPASAAFIPSAQLTFTHNEWLQGVRYEYAAFVLPVQETMGFGGSVFLLDSGDINYRDNTGSIVDTGNYKATAMAATVCYSQKLSENFSVGANGRMVQQRIENETADCFQADIGALMKLGSGFSVGVAVRNLGQDIKFISSTANDPDPSPADIKAGFMLKMANGILTIAGDAGLVNMETLSFSAGTEICMQNVFLRTGYELDPNRLSVGGGMALQNIIVDYCWIVVGELGNSHRISLGIRLK